MQSNREFGYDFIRFVAILLIIFFHFFTTCIEKGYRFPSLLKHVIVHGSIGWGGRSCPILYAIRCSINDDK